MEETKNGAPSGAGKALNLWEITNLPSLEFDRAWKRIQGCKAVKTRLQGYALTLKQLAEHGVDRRDQDIYGLVLLKGEPGTGKTQLAKGFASQYAALLGKPAAALSLRAERVFSEYLGESSKELSKAFEAVRVAAAQGPVVVIVDEIEAICFARRKVINSADPSDLVRFVDQLLREIDALQQFPYAVTAGTSNFADAMDEAFVSRADLVIDVPLPDCATRLAILQARAKALRPLGLALEREELQVIAKAAEGLSGRALGRVFLQSAWAKGAGFDEITAEDALATLKAG